MPRVNKYLYLYVVQTLTHTYKWGWEDVTQSESHQEARSFLKDYRDNHPFNSHRLISRRQRKTVVIYISPLLNKDSC